MASTGAACGQADRRHRALTEALADLDVSLAQWDTLRHLARHPDASLHDLAQLTFQTDQAFGTLAARMVARGLIERKPGPGGPCAIASPPRASGPAPRESRRVLGAQRRSFVRLTATQLDQLGELLGLVLASVDEREAAPEA